MAESARIEELRRRVQLDPASIAFAALAEEYRRAGQYEDAIAACEAGLQRHPAYISARVTLGRSLLELGRFDEARHQLEHVLRTAPENLAAIRALAEIHERAGDYADAHYSPDQDETSQDKTPLPTAQPKPPAPAAVVTPSFGPIPLSKAPIAAPRPAEPVRSSSSPGSSGSPAPPAQAAAAVPPRTPPVPAQVAAPPPPAPVRPVHPDEGAIPALEAFLAAIHDAKAAGRPPFE